MRILVIAPHPYYIDRGTPIDVDLLVRALSERGDLVDLACFPEGEPRDYPGVTIHRPRAPAWLREFPPGFSLKKIVADLLLGATVLDLLRRNDYDVIHAGEEAAFGAALVEWFTGTPFIYDLDSSVAQQMVEQFPWLKPLSRLFDGVEAWALRRCVAAAPVCGALAELAEARGAPYVQTLHDISQLDPQTVKPTGLLEERWGIRRPALLYVGNLRPYQGVDLLLDAFRLALEEGSELDLVVAGGRPDDIAAYRSRVEALGRHDRVHFIGPWPADRLGELLAEATILASPRIKGVNTPMKIFPYLHSGRPVLVTELPTHTQILDPGVAMLAEPSPEPFSRAILRLEEDEELRRSLGEAGHRFVEEDHTFEAHRRRVEELYRHVEERVGAGRAVDLRSDGGRRSSSSTPV